jgi:hypothetical protein
MCASARRRTALARGATAGPPLTLGSVLNLPDQTGLLFLPAYRATDVAAGYLRHNRGTLPIPVLTVVLLAPPSYPGSARRLPDRDRLPLRRRVRRNPLTGDGVVAAGLVALGVGLRGASEGG